MYTHTNKEGEKKIYIYICTHTCIMDAYIQKLMQQITMTGKTQKHKLAQWTNLEHYN